MCYLVGTDGSETSNKAIEYAVKDASKWNENLEIAYVLTPEIKIVDGNIVLPGESEAIQYSERMLEHARQRAITVVDQLGSSIEITTKLLAGIPANAITAYVEERKMKRIYVGHRGLSDDYDQVGGSVAKSIVEKSTVPVTIVK